MTRRCREMEDGREVCLEEEVERLRRSGMSAAEISRIMGVDEGWVEQLISLSTGGHHAEPDGRTG